MKTNAERRMTSVTPSPALDLTDLPTYPLHSAQCVVCTVHAPSNSVSGTKAVAKLDDRVEKSAREAVAVGRHRK